MFLIVNVAPLCLAHRLKDQHQPIRKLAMQNAGEDRSSRCAARWRRMLLKAQHRAMWHIQGLLLWLVQRPGLRFLPWPYPSVKSCEEWQAQLEVMRADSIWPRRHLRLAASRMTLSRLGECLHLRDRVGFKLAFLEDGRMFSMVGNLSGFRGQKVAVSRALQHQAQEEARAKLADGQRDQCVKELIGPRGGLPSLKADLLKLATLLHVPVLETDRVEDLKKKVTPAVALLMGGTTVARSKAGQLAVEAVASKSAPSAPKAKHPALDIAPKAKQSSVPVALTAENLRNYVPEVSYAERMGVLSDDQMETQSEWEYRINGEHQLELEQERLAAHHGPLDLLSAEELTRIQRDEM